MTTTSHDAVFKAVLSNPAHARGALRAAVSTRLRRRVDWDTLALAPGHFVDEELRERRADLVFAAAWRRGGPERVCFLFEHQSTPDREMPIRLARYIMRIWEQARAERGGAVTVPTVIGVVLYHGPAPWQAPPALEDVQELPPEDRAELACETMRHQYYVDDLWRAADAELGARDMTGLAKLTVLCLKHAREDVDIIALLAGWRDLLAEVAAARRSPASLALVLRYILMVNVRVEPAALSDLLARVLEPEAKDRIMEKLMSYGERLLEKGRTEGRAEGRTEGKVALLLSLMRQRFGAEVDPALEQRVSAASAAELDRWSLRLLTAPTLAELFTE